MIKKLFLHIFTFSALALSLQAQVAYAPSSFLVVRLKNFQSLETAVDNLRSYAAQTPSVREFLDPVWDKVSSFDIKSEFSKLMDLEIAELEDYFSNPAVLSIGGDFNLAKTEGIMPVAIILSGRNTTAAQGMYKTITTEEEVISLEKISNRGLNYTKILARPVEATDEDKAKREPDEAYVAVEGLSLVITNTSAYMEETLLALQGKGSSSDAFWTKASDADLALWINPQPFLAFLRGELTLELNAAEDEGETLPYTIEMFDSLGLGDLKSFGVTALLAPFEVRCELNYNPDTKGVLSFLNCLQTGIEETPLIPDGSLGFSISRLDLNCLWGELKKVVFAMVPATEGMYNGWVKQLEEKYQVNVNDRLFGNLGSRELVYETQDGRSGLTSVFFVEISDAQGFQTALDAMLGFSSPGHSYFEKTSIANTPVWRLKNQYQQGNVPPVAYSIMPGWLVVSIGDPAEIENAIRSIGENSLASVWKDSALREILKEKQNLAFLSQRPLSAFFHELAGGIAEYDLRRSEELGEEPLFDEEIPSFSDVKGSVISATTVERGVISTSVKINNP